MLTQERLKELFDYQDGQLIRRTNRASNGNGKRWIGLVTNNIIAVTMDAATGAVGTLSTSSAAGVDVTGETATSQLGKLLIWGTIIPGQDPSWGSISDSQDPGWQEVA